MQAKYDIIKSVPPIFAKLKKQFGVNWDDGICVAYGDKIYTKYDIAPDVLIHEEVHLQQQKEIGVEKWWNLYLNNKNFRMNQEIEAHKKQAEFLLNLLQGSRTAGKRYASWKLGQMAKDLSGPMYGRMMTLKEANKILGI